MKYNGLSSNEIRSLFLNVVLFPSKSEVISLSSKDLISIIDIEDPEQEYNKLLNEYNKESLIYNENLKSLNKSNELISSFWVADPRKSKEDYIKEIEKLQKNNANILKSVRKQESLIKSVETQLDNIKNKIELEKDREQKEIQNKKDTIDNNILKEKEALNNIKNKIELNNSKIKNNNIQLKYIENEYISILDFIKNIDSDNCKCTLCNQKIKNARENPIYNKMLIKKESQEKIILELNDKINKCKSENQELAQELILIKEELQNNLNFKSTNMTTYQKKSIKILELEAKRNEMQKSLLVQEQKLENIKKSLGKDYEEIDLKIKKYYLSIDNLNMLEEQTKNTKEYKSIISEQYIKIDKLKERMNVLKKYIMLKWKIISNRVSYLFGNDFKFNLLDFDEYNIIEKIDFTYQDKTYDELEPNIKQAIDKIFIAKINFLKENS